MNGSLSSHLDLHLSQTDTWMWTLAPTQVPENQYRLWALHRETCCNLPGLESGVSPEQIGRNLSGFVMWGFVGSPAERQMPYLFASDWWLWHKLHDILLPGVSDGTVGWHITENTAVLINIHSASCAATKQMARLLFLHKPTRNCYISCMQSTT